MEQEKLYSADLGIYVNCHIVQTMNIEFQAKNTAEANTIAQQRANDMEGHLSKKHPEDDIWVDVEDVYL